MSLVPRERETLAAIENQVRATDPRFAAMFRQLGNLGPRSQGSLWVFLSVWVARRGAVHTAILLATILTLLSTCAVAAAVLT